MHCRQCRQWRSQKGGGDIDVRAMSPKANHRGPTYILPPSHAKANPVDLLGLQAEVDSVRYQGLARRIRAPRPREGSGSRKTNQNPAG